MKDKHFALLATTFCVTFGLMNCSFNDFMSGIFTGLAIFVTCFMWDDE